MLKEFKAFVMQGNILMLAVAFVIGLAFSAVVKALVADLITPILAIPGHANFSTLYFTINGSPFLYGDFINAVVEFVVIAAAIFVLVVKPYNLMVARRSRGQDPDTKTCPECLTDIPYAATRCAACTSVQPAAGVAGS
jgi:large conductance mechanosensitive channel